MPRNVCRYRFSNPWLLRLALVHSSAAPLTNNTQLSWLGDAALGLTVTEQIMVSTGVQGAMGVRAQVRGAVESDHPDPFVPGLINPRSTSGMTAHHPVWTAAYT